MTQQPLPSMDQSLDSDNSEDTAVYPTVVIIGQLNQEGVTSKIRSLGYRYSQRLLASSPENWEKITNYLIKMRAIGNIVAIVVHLPEWAIFMAIDNPYRSLWFRMLREIEKHRSLLFIYEDNSVGVFTTLTRDIEMYNDFKKKIFPNLSDEDRFIFEEDQNNRIQEALNQAQNAKLILNETYKYQIEIVTYKKNAEVTVRINDFLEEIDSGTFLRLYVPNGRYQAEQFAGLLRMFENYLQNVEGKSFVIDTRKTDNGTVYIFRSKDNITTVNEIEDALSRFDTFMSYCQHNAIQAELMLKDMGLSKGDATFLVAKYNRNYQRLLLDMRYERDQKVLALKYELDSDVLEAVSRRILPSLEQIDTKSMFSLEGSGNTFNININELNDNKKSVINSTIGGGINYTDQDYELIKLFNEHTEHMVSLQLRSELEQLKDPQTSSSNKLSAKQRIMAFLFKIPGILGEATIKGFATYLEQLASGQTS